MNNHSELVIVQRRLRGKSEENELNPYEESRVMHLCQSSGTSTLIQWTINFVNIMIGLMKMKSFQSLDHLSNSLNDNEKLIQIIFMA